MPYSKQEFAAQIKAKYPEYQSWPDDYLADQMVQKYPEYKSWISADGAKALPKGVTATPNENGGVTYGVEDTPKPSYWEALTNPVGAGGRAQGVGGGALQVGGQAIKALAAPFTHPVDTASSLVRMGRAALSGNPYTFAQETVTPAVEQFMDDKSKGGTALAVENAAGGAIGTAESGRMVPAIAEGTLKRLGSGSRIALQEAAGAGREPVRAAERARAETAAATDAQNAAGRRDWVEREHATRRAEQQNAATTAQAKTIERGQRAYVDRTLQNAQQAFKATKSGLDQRWNALRQRIGNNPINSQPLADAIEDAKSRYLMGAPESLKQFNDLIRTMESDKLLDAPGGPKPMLRQLSWEEGRAHYTALGDKLYSGELPGSVMKAVDHVRGELDRELSATAEAGKMGKFYSQTKADWSQFKSDWDDMRNTSMAKSATGNAGSPLARLVRARTPEAAAKVMTDDRLAGMMAKYAKSGANPKLIDAFRKLDAQLGTLEKSRVPARPKPFEPKAGPEPINPKEIRAKRLENYASQPFKWYDFLSPTGVSHALLKSDALRNWVASQPRKELVP